MATGLAEMLPVLVFFGTLAAAWYLLITRPQHQQRGRHESLVERLQPGDHVMTVGGLYGRVQTIEGNTVVVELAPGVVTRVNSDGIARIVAAAEAPSMPAAPYEQQHHPAPAHHAVAVPHPEYTMTHHPDQQSHQPHHGQPQHGQLQHGVPQHALPPAPWTQPQVAGAVARASQPQQFDPARHLPSLHVPSAPPMATGYGVPVDGQHSTFRAAVTDSRPAPFTPRSWQAPPIVGAVAPAPPGYAPAPGPAPAGYQPQALAQQHHSPPPPAGTGAFRFSLGSLMPQETHQAHYPQAPQPQGYHLAPTPVAYGHRAVQQQHPQHQAYTPQYAQEQPHPQAYAAQPAYQQPPQHPAYATQPATQQPSPAGQHPTNPPLGNPYGTLDPSHLRKHSVAPQGMGTSVRMDDPALQEAFQRARDERHELAGEYRRSVAPMVGDTAQPPPPAVPGHPELAQHQPMGTPLFVTQGAPAANNAVSFPATPQLQQAEPGMPRPRVQVQPMDPETAAAFQRRAPYVPEPQGLVAGAG